MIGRHINLLRRRRDRRPRSNVRRRVVLLITMGIERPSGLRYFNIARELVKRGDHVRILALHPDLANCPQRRFIQDGVEVWYVGQMHARKSGRVTERFGPWQLLQVLIQSTLGMIWGVLCSPADVYHLGKPQPINGVAALISIMLLRRQRFYVDCDDDEVWSNRLNAAWQRQIFAFWQWLLPRLAVGVTVNTLALAERIAAIGRVPYVYVPNGVDLARFNRPPERYLIGLRRSLDIIDQQVVAYIGTLALQNHPVDLLIDAFASVATDLPAVRLLLIGGGEDVATLQERIRSRGLQNRVHFTGHLPHAAVPLFLSLADLSVDPVHDDEVARTRSPLKLVESLALGVPVLTGDVGDRRMMLADGAGWVVPAGDVAALAQALRDRLADQNGLRTARAKALQTVQQYTWQALCDHWVTLYERRDD